MNELDYFSLPCMYGWILLVARIRIQYQFYFCFIFLDIHTEKLVQTYKNMRICLSQCDSVGWSIVPYAKRLGFDSWSGTMPKLQVLSLVKVYKGGNLSHQCFSLSLFLPLFLKSINSLKIEREYENINSFLREWNLIIWTLSSLPKTT